MSICPEECRLSLVGKVFGDKMLNLPIDCFTVTTGRRIAEVGKYSLGNQVNGHVLDGASHNSNDSMAAKSNSKAVSSGLTMVLMIREDGSSYGKKYIAATEAMDSQFAAATEAEKQIPVARATEDDSNQSKKQ
ncbi:hypothetical protein ACH5RR_015779 [Cinchona calisaya]|uniref:Uncharacterized protein n=1 Tax=Cinchona calisaya TaxID=153742 RepID=A0ABD2ZXI9_9GENT